MTKALDILHQEHRAIMAVIHCLDHVVDEVRNQELEIEFDLLRAILDYIRDYPDEFHHPKEDRYLFPAVKAKAPDVASVVEELEEQHEAGERMLAALAAALEDWAATPDDDARAEAFCTQAKDYIDFQRRHAAKEERTVMPAARKALDADDWAEINAAFTDNDDPMFGAQPKAAFNKLFSKIVQLAPQPWGMAERHAPPPKDATGEVDENAESWSDQQRQALLSLHWI